MNAALLTCKKNAQLLVKYNESTLAENRLLIFGPKVKEHLKKADMETMKEMTNEERLHGRLLQARWQDSTLIQRGCFAWLRYWTCAPTHYIAGIMGIYEQLTPSKVYTVHKTGTKQGDISCSMSGKSPETLAHVLLGCSALVQCKYMERHNAALKVFFFLEMARELGLIDSFPPWYSPAVPKPIYESPGALAFWDVPVYVEHTIVMERRVDNRFVDNTKKVRAHQDGVGCGDGLSVDAESGKEVRGEHG